MQPEHKLYTYTYLYKISNSGSSFIRKMISLFVSSLDEYVIELETLQAQKNLQELKKVLHKMKPSVMNLEVKGAGDILKSLSNATSWSNETDQRVSRLKEIFATIRPMMEDDLVSLGDDDN
jgi:HPt (histidine-containing phosphotransfer) domain-containing protein